MEQLQFKVMSSWTRLQNAFPHRFIIEFEYISEDNPQGNNVRYFKKYKNIFVKYLNENYGNETTDWMIAKQNGPYNFGASLMVGFRDNTNAAAFILENT
ncbi:MAG: hypothetical protein RIQ70_928 [Bacteroidota bacterium]|jgi:hypothetical protein